MDTMTDDTIYNEMIDGRIRDQLNLLYTLVQQSPVNVTAIKDKQEFAIKHILDSLYFFLKNPMEVKSVMDLGSGGGFPGIVLALYYPKWHITLIDSVGKKCAFMEDTAKKLGLKNITVVNSRAEIYSGKTFDLITARGVGTVKDVLKFTSHLAHNSSSWVMYKGERLAAEMEEAAEDIEKKGLKSEILRVERPFTRSYLYLHG